MITHYNKHIFTKSFGLALSAFCWILAAIQFCSNINIHNAKMITAFLEESQISPYITSKTNKVSYFCNDSNIDNNHFYNYSIKNINCSTKEIIPSTSFKNQSEAYDLLIYYLSQLDNNTSLISCNNTYNYKDYYFYSQKLMISDNIKPLTQGSNIHAAITDYPVHIYIGTPYIDYDF